MEDVAQQGEPWKSGDTLKVEGIKPESAIERRHRQVLQALNGEIPNAVYESKRELVELLNVQHNELIIALERNREVNSLNHHNLRQSRKEQHKYHMDQIAAARSEADTASESHKAGTRTLIKINAIASITRVAINASILAVMVIYLLDMG